MHAQLLSPPMPARVGTAADVLSAVDVTVPPRRVSPRYRAAIAATALALALIPLLYLVLVGFVGWLFAWHVYRAALTANVGPFATFHILMAILGGFLLLILIKPVFFRRKAAEGRVITMSAAQQPLLFEFVHRVCTAVGATPPAAIEVDCQANAHARLARGMKSGTGGRHVLRIGLPLVDAMPVDQFAGLLAHEFGHFNQRTGMRGTFVIRRLNRFFAGVVFGRDAVDRRLMRLRRSRRRGRVFYQLAHVTTESARGVLWLMLLSGELLTRNVLRQMEHDADLLEAQLCGPGDFERTGQLMMFLGIAAHMADLDVHDALQRMRLADNLPKLISANAKLLKEKRGKVLQLLKEQKTCWFDTHPCHNDRVRYVQKHVPLALIHCKQPAKVLFADFDAVCRAATQCAYEQALGERLETAKLTPTADIVAERAGQRQTMRALRRFLQGRVVRSRLILPPSAIDLTESATTTLKQLRSARDQMVALSAGLEDAAADCDSASEKIIGATAQRELFDLFKRNPRVYSRKVKALAELNAQEAIRKQTVATLLPFETTAAARLTAALQLLQLPKIAARVTPANANATDSDRPEFARLLLGVCEAVRPSYADVPRLRELGVGLQMGLAGYNADRPYPPLVQFINARASRIYAMLKRINHMLGTIPYPFEHGSDIGAVSDVVVQKIPPPERPGELLVAAFNVAARFDTLMLRTLAALTEWAEKTETAVGLPSLPEPPDPASETAIEERALQQRTHTRRFWLRHSAWAASGLILLGTLVGLSLRPPRLRVWAEGSSTEYRPAAFGTAAVPPTAPSAVRAAGPRSGPTFPPALHIVAAADRFLAAGPPVATRSCTAGCTPRTATAGNAGVAVAGNSGEPGDRSEIRPTSSPPAPRRCACVAPVTRKNAEDHA